ncbi:MAG: hypothetical protein R2789_12940 [Microthrixaceae bacterium]
MVGRSRSGRIDQRLATRVVDVQRQAGLSLVAAGLFLVAAVVAAIVPNATGSWLPLHLFLVGALLCAVSGVTQMLAVTWSTSPAPTDSVAWAQRLSVVSGAVAVAIGRELEVHWLVVFGAGCLAAGLMALGGVLIWIRRNGSTDRFRPAIDTYLAAVLWGLVGLGLGATLATTEVQWWPRLRSAHLFVNLLGLVGLVIAGTLPYFAATQARMKMFPGATATRIRATTMSMAGSVVLVSAGELAEAPWWTVVGLLAYAAGLTGIVWLLPRMGRRQFRWAGARLFQLLAGLAWWILCVVWLAADSVPSRESLGGLDRSTSLRVLAIGGFAQILVASLAYLAPVIRGGGHSRLTAGFAITRSWIGLAAANVAAVAVAAGWSVVAGAAIVLWLIDTIVRALRLWDPMGRGRPQPSSRNSSAA